MKISDSRNANWNLPSKFPLGNKILSWIFKPSLLQLWTYHHLHPDHHIAMIVLKKCKQFPFRNLHYIFLAAVLPKFSPTEKMLYHNNIKQYSLKYLSGLQGNKIALLLKQCLSISRLILGFCPANERWRYFVTMSLIDWARISPAYDMAGSFIHSLTVI